MGKLIVLAVVISRGVACDPHCMDPNVEDSGVTDCRVSGLPVGYCQCFMRHVMERHFCPDINSDSVPPEDLTEACDDCAELLGGTCN